MLTCIPARGDAGLDDTLSDHFGSAPFYVIYDSVSDTIDIVKNQNTKHTHGACNPLSELASYQIDSIVCSAIGKRAIDVLNSEGIKVYYSDKKSVRDVVKQIRNNNLPEMDPAAICPGHGERTGFIHGTLHGEGCKCGKGHGSGTHHHGEQNCCQESRFDNKDNQ
jgi:predicted Fe-Mo cluster-binding NifX family protein